jgi:hypothetical protein
MPKYDAVFVGSIYLPEIGGGPIHPPGEPPGLWPPPGHPAHPIAPGGPPPGIWPGPGVPTPPIYYPPGIWPPPGHPDHGLPGPPPGIWPGPGVPTPPIYYPPGIWPPPGHPAHPIAPGGLPPGIWPSPGYPVHPIAPGGPPPGIWPSPGHPAHPIAPGGGPEPPPVYQPVPPDSSLTPPSSAGTGLPDLASPGYWCLIALEGTYSRGFIQTALLGDPDHEPRPPTQGVPGTWMLVYGGTPPVVCSAWLPDLPPTATPTPGGRRSRSQE